MLLGGFRLRVLALRLLQGQNLTHLFRARIVWTSPAFGVQGRRRRYLSVLEMPLLQFLAIATVDLFL